MEKLKFGQYFTTEILANIVAFPAVRSNEDVLLDPTSGTGTFLSSFYNILSYYRNDNPKAILSQIWGNDISHFPAILSVINLYKHNVTMQDNFPRVIRGDFFNLEVGKTEVFPDPVDYRKHINVPIPQFDGIASNLPFIQQEDIPNDKLTEFFRQKFEQSQRAFLHKGFFKINERSDYFTYCVYHAIKFLKDGGILSVITSNAWLGKEYGDEFKSFLLDNFHIKYIVKSNAEHWFHDSQVTTIYFVLEKGAKCDTTRFVTFNFKLNTTFDSKDINHQLAQIESLYDDIDNCDGQYADNWTKNEVFEDLYEKTDGSMSVCVVPKAELERSIDGKTNWNIYFTSANVLSAFDNLLVKYNTNVFESFRGVRTGWDTMFVIPNKEDTKIDGKWLINYIKGPTELHSIKFDDAYKNRLFVCGESISTIDRDTANWIRKFENAQNKNGSRTVREACKSNKPYWWTLSPKQAEIFIAVNPYKRLFFTYSEQLVTFNQRLTGFVVKKGYDIKLVAALLNSVISLLTIELKGINRHSGALDLNANFFKEMKFLNPDLLNQNQKAEIIAAFEPISKRKIEKIFAEFDRQDRINFDKVVFRCFGIDDKVRKVIYDLLTEAVYNRVSLKDKSGD